MKNDFIKNLFNKTLLIFYFFVITFLLYISLLIKYNNEFNFINKKYNNEKNNTEKITYINSSAFKIKELILLKKTKEKLFVSNQIVKIEKIKNNNYRLNINNYYDRCSNINGSYFLEGKDFISWMNNIEKINKIYTINIVPKDNIYIKNNYCLYNLILELNYKLDYNDIIYIMVNGSLYKYQLKDLYEKK